jgi:hypothetical protein
MQHNLSDDSHTAVTIQQVPPSAHCVGTDIDIGTFTYIPKIQKLLQTLDTEHVINQSMKAPSKQNRVLF